MSDDTFRVLKNELLHDNLSILAFPNSRSSEQFYQNFLFNLTKLVQFVLEIVEKQVVTHLQSSIKDFIES